MVFAWFLVHRENWFLVARVSVSEEQPRSNGSANEELSFK
jgi:predicted GNAT superfamily acetyltransferase